MMMRLLCIFWSISYSATTTGGIIRLCYYSGYIQYRNKPSKTKTNYAHHIAKIYNSNNGNIIYYILPSYKYYDVYRNVLINSLEKINDTLVFFLVFWIQCKIIQIGKNTQRLYLSQKKKNRKKSMPTSENLLYNYKGISGSPNGGNLMN